MTGLRAEGMCAPAGELLAPYSLVHDASAQAGYSALCCAVACGMREVVVDTGGEYRQAKLRCRAPLAGTHIGCPKRPYVAGAGSALYGAQGANQPLCSGRCSCGRR